MGDFPEWVEQLRGNIVARKSNTDNHLERKTREKEKEKEAEDPIRTKGDQESRRQQAIVFKEVVAGWVEALETKILKSGLVNHHKPEAARSFVGMALYLLRRGLWGNLEKDLKNYGIPKELLRVLKAYKARNLILEQIATTDPELTGEVYQTLLNGSAPTLNHTRLIGS